MTKRELNFKITLFILFLFISESAMAFSYNQSSATGYMDATTFPNYTGNVESLSSSGASVPATGWPNSSYKDMVKIYSVELDSQMQSRGFTLEVKVGNSDWMEPSASVGKCVWVYDNCTVSFGGAVSNYPTVPVYIRLKRNSSATYTAIFSNTLIATVKLRMNNYNAYDTTLLPLYFRFNGSVNPVVRTCDIKNYDNNVTLPGVSRTDLVSHGIGRYTGAKKEFSINLECENSPKVSVKFDGSKMSGVAGEDVLANKLSGNDNVGIQLVYNNNALKIGSAVELLSAAGANELLKFNAHYYYKGGTVQSGQVKANSEFTFTYE